MRPLQSLTLAARLTLLSTAFKQLPDPRRADRVDYRRHDTLMSGFAMMFLQHPSLVECQRKMPQRRGRCTLAPILGVHAGPSASQRRDILEGGPVEL